MSIKPIIDSYTDRFMTPEQLTSLYHEGRNMDGWLLGLIKKSKAAITYDKHGVLLGWIIKRGVSLPRKRKLIKDSSGSLKHSPGTIVKPPKDKLTNNQPTIAQLTLLQEPNKQTFVNPLPKPISKTQRKATKFLFDVLS